MNFLEELHENIDWKSIIVSDCVSSREYKSNKQKSMNIEDAEAKCSRDNNNIREQYSFRFFLHASRERFLLLIRIKFVNLIISRSTLCNFTSINLRINMTRTTIVNFQINTQKNILISITICIMNLKHNLNKFYCNKKNNVNKQTSFIQDQ